MAGQETTSTTISNNSGRTSGFYLTRVGVATPLFDRAIEVHQHVIDEGFGEYDHAVLVDVIGGMKRTKAKKAAGTAKKKTATKSK